MNESLENIQKQNLKQNKLVLPISDVISQKLHQNYEVKSQGTKYVVFNLPLTQVIKRVNRKLTKKQHNLCDLFPEQTKLRDILLNSRFSVKSNVN